MLREMIVSLCPGVDPSLATSCPRCGADDHGPLRAVSAPVVVSVSYSGPFVAVAAAPSSAATALGIDIELGAADAALDGLATLFAPADPPTRREWTAIEAAVKADGRGLNVSPERVRLDADRAHVPGAGLALAIHSLDAPAGLTATLAIAT